jgi:hypothetical protein
MIYMWFTCINYYKLSVKKDRVSIFTTISTLWKPGLNQSTISGMNQFLTSFNGVILPLTMGSIKYKLFSDFQHSAQNTTSDGSSPVSSWADIGCLYCTKMS